MGRVAAKTVLTDLKSHPNGSKVPHKMTELEASSPNGSPPTKEENRYSSCSATLCDEYSEQGYGQMPLLVTVVIFSFLSFVCYVASVML
jgi:hypothetical protein